jgi:hypothetical protein
MAACGIAPEDDDGNAAVKGKGDYDFAAALNRAETADKVEAAREAVAEARAMAIKLKDASAAKAIAEVQKRLAAKFAGEAK